MKFMPGIKLGWPNRGKTGQNIVLWTPVTGLDGYFILQVLTLIRMEMHRIDPRRLLFWEAGAFKQNEAPKISCLDVENWSSCQPMVDPIGE